MKLYMRELPYDDQVRRRRGSIGYDVNRTRGLLNALKSKYRCVFAFGLSLNVGLAAESRCLQVSCALFNVNVFIVNEPIY